MKNEKNGFVRITLLILALTVSAVSASFISFAQEELTDGYALMHPEEGKTFFEQVDSERALCGEARNYYRVVLEPVEKGTKRTVYDTQFFPEFFGPMDDCVLVIDITWKQDSAGVYRFNKKYDDLSEGESYYPVYQIIVSAEISPELVLGLLEERADVYFAYPYYEDEAGWISGTVYFPKPLPPEDERPGWYDGAVKYALDNGLMNGMYSGYDYRDDDVKLSGFLPGGTVTRAQAVQVFYNISGQSVQAEQPFSDVDESDWYYSAVTWANASGLVNGTTDTTFEPLKDVTREQFVTMLYRYTVNGRYCSELHDDADVGKYADVGEISSFAKDAMTWAVENGYIKGENLHGENGITHVIDPKGTITRAEMATLLQRFYKYNFAYAPEYGMSEEEFYTMLHRACK